MTTGVTEDARRLTLALVHSPHEIWRKRESAHSLVMGPSMILPFGITTRFGFPRFKYCGWRLRCFGGPANNGKICFSWKMLPGNKSSITQFLTTPNMFIFVLFSLVADVEVFLCRKKNCLSISTLPTFLVTSKHYEKLKKKIKGRNQTLWSKLA